MSESKSPRLLWMEKHGVETGGPDEDDEFWAKCGDSPSQYAYGQTEEQAIIAIAVKNKWKLWNEEGEQR